jgi:hypothetical protein
MIRLISHYTIVGIDAITPLGLTLMLGHQEEPDLGVRCGRGRPPRVRRREFMGLSPF